MASYLPLTLNETERFNSFRYIGANYICGLIITAFSGSISIQKKSPYIIIRRFNGDSSLKSEPKASSTSSNGIVPSRLCSCR